MERIKWIKHKGKDILYLDYSNLRGSKDGEVFTQIIDNAKTLIVEKKEKVLFLTNSIDGTADTKVMKLLKDFAKYCKDNDFIEKECVVGITGVKKVLLNAVNKFAKTNLEIIETVEKAKDWLVQ
ncbi:MAG: hypothetical protein GY870_07280 [archaeon]|nr:hypothetical protein [archaeon]